MSTPVLDLQGVAFAYPDGHQALHGVDLHVHQGERVALLGPNGAGKTTLVLHLNGILHGGGGTVEVSGVPVDPGDRAGLADSIEDKGWQATVAVLDAALAIRNLPA